MPCWVWEQLKGEQSIILAAQELQALIIFIEIARELCFAHFLAVTLFVSACNFLIGRYDFSPNATAEQFIQKFLRLRCVMPGFMQQNENNKGAIKANARLKHCDA